MQNTTKEDRSHLIYDNGYGKTADIYQLPVGTTFSVSNGAWDGTIIEENGVKYLLIDGTDRKVELKPDGDYGLSIYNVKTPRPLTRDEVPHNIETIYICGKMTGIKDYNKPRFHQTAKRLRDKGFTVYNPAEIDGDKDWTWTDYMRQALKQMMECDAIFVLNGYETSRGATIEIDLAHKLGILVIYENEHFV